MQHISDRVSLRAGCNTVQTFAGKKESDAKVKVARFITNHKWKFIFLLVAVIVTAFLVVFGVLDGSSTVNNTVAEEIQGGVLGSILTVAAVIVGLIVRAVVWMKRATKDIGAELMENAEDPKFKDQLGESMLLCEVAEVYCKGCP